MPSAISRFVPVALLACGCGDRAQRSASQHIEISTAALALPGVDFACYDVRVDNGGGDTVVQRGDPSASLLSATPDDTTLCSTRYGNGPGGAISYVAPCDADEPNHTVTLWVDGLYTGTPASPGAVAYEDPCASGCSLKALCQANADTAVVFDLTIARPANQGFFDVAVNFDDVFCSAKVDCATDAGPIALLHHPSTGERAQTAVLALACTSGPGGAATVLLRDQVVVTCDASRTVIAMTTRTR